ncbi:MAG: hypothetical protein LBM67_05440 [Lentimicrobiaceae bacterium]|jgi:hypothetical protein|nr:hypothetical protein [Lentimicrobiaceae bacterium]
MKKLIMIIACCCLISMNCTAQNENEKHVEDIEFLRENLPKKHKNLFFKISETEFNRELNALAAKNYGSDSWKFALDLQKIFAKIGDSHTNCNFFAEINDSSIPLTATVFDDGIFVVSVAEKHKSALGCKISSINNFPIAQVIDSLKTLIVQDNKAMNKLLIPMLLSYSDIFKFFGFIPEKSNSLTISFVDSENRKIEETFELNESVDKSEYVKVKPVTIPLFLQNPNKIFWDNYSETDSVYYVQYNSCISREIMLENGDSARAAKLPSFNEFTEKIFQTIEQKPIKRFIFDMRSNGGGSSAQGTEFVQQLKKNKKVNRKGKLFVIIGRSTFSSAIINTLDFERETEAISVGEETAGKPNHYGEVRGFSLPNSKIYVQYSTKYFKFIDENLNTIKPQIKVKYNFYDYLNGIDTSFEEILNFELNS